MFRGDKDSMDVKKFSFLFEHVIARGTRDESELGGLLLAHLEGPAFEFFYDKYAYEDKLSDEVKDFEAVKEACFERFSEEKDADEVIREAVDLRLSNEDLEEFIKTAEDLYSDAGFNDEARFGLLRKAVQSRKHLMQFLVNQGPATYEGLKTCILEYQRWSRLYSTESTKTQKKRFVTEEESQSSANRR